jgi:hypothetical protein
MQSGFRHLAGCVVALLVALPAFAQFGHPLKGTWSGDWGPSRDKRTHIVLELNWDGKAITGNINPGPNAVPIQKAALDADKWLVHIEADGKDASGRSVRYLVDGKLENIGAYARVLSGTWTEGGTKGDFKVVRN